jgi:hypothetical protein
VRIAARPWRASIAPPVASGSSHIRTLSGASSPKRLRRSRTRIRASGEHSVPCCADLDFSPSSFSSAAARAIYRPVRLYLVLSFLFFLLVTITSPVTSRSAPAIASNALDMKSSPRNALDEHAPAEMSDESQRLRASGGTLMGNINAAAERERILNLCNASTAHLPGPDWLRQPFFRACVRTDADQNRELGRTFVHDLGRALFLLLPLLAALMLPLYQRPKRYYVDHMLLLAHNHACVFLVMSGFIVAVHWIPSGKFSNLATFALILYLLIYLYSSMRRVYGESRARTLLKFSALSVGYFICAACTVLLTGLYSAEML